MKSVLLTGINGTVAQVMKKELDQTYDLSGISIVRMDEVLAAAQSSSWQEQLDAYRDRVMEQLTTACKGVDAVVHLGWNTRDEATRHCATALESSCATRTGNRK